MILMAMTIKTDGLTEVGEILTALGERAEEVASGALYDGAGVVADAFGKAVSRIKTAPFKGKRSKRMPSPEEKAALAGKTGVAKFRKNGGEVETLIGVSGAAGYAMIGNRRVAVREIARSINHGTSFMTKQPVFRQAVTTSDQPAQKAIVDKAEKMFDDIINGK